MSPANQRLAIVILCWLSGLVGGWVICFIQVQIRSDQTYTQPVAPAPTTTPAANRSGWRGLAGGRRWYRLAPTSEPTTYTLQLNPFTTQRERASVLECLGEFSYEDLGPTTLLPPDTED